MLSGEDAIHPCHHHATAFKNQTKRLKMPPDIRTRESNSFSNAASF